MQLKSEITTIHADEKIFLFNDGFQTSYSDDADIIFVKGDVLPDNTNSIQPRDLMSSRAVLAHEYYGHRANRNTPLRRGSWNDEFRASYSAAVNAPNLSSDDRRCLMLDAYERAKEGGQILKYNQKAREIIYGR